MNEIAVASADACDSTTARLHNGPAVRIGSIGLAVGLIVLSGCALLGAFLSDQAGVAAKHGAEVSDAFEDARYFLQAEETLERMYRLEPSPDLRRKYEAASLSLLARLERLRVLGAEPELLNEVAAKHEKYLLSAKRVFAASDAAKPALAKEIHEGETNPLFSGIERLVIDAAARHRSDSVQTLENLRGIERAILIATPLLLLPGMALVLFFSALLRRYRRQVANSLIHEAGALRHSEEHFRSLVQNASDVILVCSSQDLITYQSPAAETAWGYDQPQLSAKPFYELIHDEDRPTLRKTWEQLQLEPGATRSVELRVRVADGSWRNIELVLTNLLHRPTVGGIVATARDITERKELENQLRRHAFYDTLTGLPNRMLFSEHLESALQRRGSPICRVGLLFLDLDNFKQINDSLGNQAGDRLLAEAASRIKDCVSLDSMVARLGGDEFVVFLDEVNADADVLLVADRIAQAFSRPFALDGREFVVTASIGIRLGNAGHEVAHDMQRDADFAMYQAKRAGKARQMVFDVSMHSDAAARLETETELRQAVEKGQLCLHYQPIVCLDDGRFVGLEALVRWQHPVRGLISPAEFIPLAEETGVIVPLGQWVLEAACRQAALWQQQYPSDPPLSISVNLSPRQFENPNLLYDVERALRETGLPASSLRLEITEGVVMNDADTAITTLSCLKKLGIQLAIDDFGTGYSSLAYLKRLPLDAIKIDRSFVNGIGQNVEDTAIVRAIISMAKSLNLTLTAEGIENAEQCALLRRWGCDRGQGYYFARPLDAQALSQLLSRAGNTGKRSRVA